MPDLLSVPAALPAWTPGDALPDNPLTWLGSTAAQVVGDVWMTTMVGLWSAGLWLLRTAFIVVDAFTTPDLSADGPLRPALETTMWLGGFAAAVLMSVQLGLLMVRRDGQSLGRLLLGGFQFGFVWLGFLGFAAMVAAGCSGVSRGILRATLNVDRLSAIDWTGSWPRDVTDLTTATVLGITSLFLIIPGAFFDVLISLVAAASQLVLVAVSPITAAGLFNETTRVWFWKSLRWFVASVLIGPTSCLVLGIGIGITKGVVYGAGDGTVAAVGTAVVGAVLVLVGAICPLALFRLLAFIDPATPSGAAMRQTWADAGGLAGLGRAAAQQASGSGSALMGDPSGGSAGEASAESANGSRLASVLGGFGRGIQISTALATRATDLSADILGSAGVGAPSYSMTPADERALRAGRGRARAAGDGPGGNPDPPHETGPGATPRPAAPTGGGAGAAAPEAGAAAAPVIIP